MNRRLIILIVALVPVGLLLIAGTAFGIDRGSNGGEILGRVTVLDAELGGLGEADARAVLEELEESLASTPIEVTAAGESFTLVPSRVGYDVDVDAVLDEAFEHGRTGGWFGQIGWWFGKWGGDDGITIDLPATFDEDALPPIIEEWELEGIDSPPSTGDVSMDGFEVVYEYPRAGTGIDRQAAAAILAEAVLDPERPAVELPTRVLVPSLTEDDIDAVVAEAERRLSGPVTLINQDLGSEMVVPRHVLAESLTITRIEGDPPTFELGWDEGPLRDYAEPRLRAYQTESRDAELVIGEDDTVSIVPSTPSQAPDPDALVAQVAEATASVTRTGPLAYTEGFEADVSTADLEALGIKEKLSEFTTYHNCCENRVINIQTIADAVDGALVAPGEEFSVNEHVGPRTTDKGYVAAGAIIGGYVQCCDSPINIGGGTSQFSTTLYNAVFYAGLEDVYHMPHTIYFSRYPEGIEATMGYPAPDLVFRNNTESWVLIKTEHTDTSITVKIFGDNGGIEVEAERSGRFGYTSPITTYEANRDLECPYFNKKNGKVVESGSSGWSIRVYRHITYPEGHYAMPEGGESTDEWFWHYDGSFRVVEYNPDLTWQICNGGGGEGGEEEEGGGA